MNRASGSARNAVSEETSSHTRLHGAVLLLARAGTFGVIALIVTMLCVSIPVYVADMSVICTSAICPAGRLTPSSVAALNAIGVSARAYVYGTLALDCVSIATWLGFAGLILWRKSAYWDGLLLATLLVTQGVSFISGVTTPLVYHEGFWHEVIFLQTFANALLFFACFALFPDGRWRPRWMRWIFLLSCVIALAAYVTRVFFPTSAYFSSADPRQGAGWFSLFSFDTFSFVLVLILNVIALPCGAGSLLYKFRVTLSARERQQTKWVLLGLLVGVGVFMCVFLLIIALPYLLSNASLFYVYFAVLPLVTIVLLSSPISLAIAVFRYNLWDIDLLIKRALVYGPLTGVLAILYFALVLGAQSAVQRVTGQQGQQPLIVVASTLLIVALVQPLRSRIQRVIDRRFYRQKYDAQKAIASFSETLRHEVSLPELQERLIAVVNETMQPARVSLWLASSSLGTTSLRQAEGTREDSGTDARVRSRSSSSPS